jgi:hypothetical protein
MKTGPELRSQELDFSQGLSTEKQHDLAEQGKSATSTDVS